MGLCLEHQRSVKIVDNPVLLFLNVATLIDGQDQLLVLQMSIVQKGLHFIKQNMFAQNVAGFSTMEHINIWKSTLFALMCYSVRFEK